MAKEFISGEIDWNEADLPSSKGEKGELFLRLAEGENIVRVMGNPVQNYIHWVTTPDGKNRKIVSPTSNPALVKRLEDAGFKRQPNWIIKVLDCKDQKFKLLEVGNQIFKGIQALFNHPKWGKVTGYDISINRGPKGTQPLYTVTPNPKESLDSSLKQKYIEFNDKVNVDKIISPMPSEELEKMLGFSPTKPASEKQMTKSSSAQTEEFDFE
jgi:hypothetical protein